MTLNINHFNIEITNNCNQKCFYCFNDSGPHAKKNNLQLMDWKNTLSSIAELGFKTVHITGGEPFLHPQIIDILQHSIEIGLETSILSNGFKIALLANQNPLLFKNIKTAQISLDSMNSVIHNLRRGNTNAYYDAISSIFTFLKLNVPVEISSTVDESNLDQIIDIGLFCKSINAAIIIRPLISDGRAKKILLNGDFTKRLDNIKSLLVSKYNVNIVKDRFCYVASDNKSDEIFLEKGIITIKADGKIRGNLYTNESLDVILLNSKILI